MARRRKNTVADGFIEVVAMLPWWAGVALAVVSYLLLHAWHQSLVTGLSASVIVVDVFVYAAQFIVPFLCLVAAVVSAVRRYRRISLADHVAGSGTRDALNGMSWSEFELLVGEGFRRQGFHVEETGGGGADGGFHLVLRRRGEKHLVQCKQWRAYKVGVDVVRELFGVMAATGAVGGFVVTSGRFTRAARQFAEGRNVRLIDGEALFELICSTADVKLSVEAASVVVVPVQKKSASLPTMRRAHGSANGKKRVTRRCDVLGMRWFP